MAIVFNETLQDKLVTGSSSFELVLSARSIISVAKYQNTICTRIKSGVRSSESAVQLYGVSYTNMRKRSSCD